MEKFIYDKAKLPRPVLHCHDDWLKLYDKTWKMAFDNVEYVDKEGWKPQLTCMPGVNTIWQWDSCIMTFITNYSNGTLNAFNNLDNLYRLRRVSDGYMSMAYRISTEKEAYGEYINPPLMAWAEYDHYLTTGDFSRFEAVLPALEGMYSFVENKRRRNCGLYWFEEPGSSGMDNSPRGGYPPSVDNGSDVCYIDLACQQALSAKYIGLIYKKLGNDQKAEFYASENKRICELINQYHWSDKGGFFYDFFARGSAKSRVKLLNIKTAAAFWTLVSGAATGKRADAVIGHMFNPDEFYTPTPFASLSKDDLNYDPTGGYWLGGVWAPTNFAAIRGLYETGHEDLARESAMRYLNAVTAVDNDPQYGTIWEVYAPEFLRPATREEGDICRRNFVGWSGIAPITMLIENIIGLRFDADKNTVRFSIPGEACGLENMLFNGGYVSVVCDEYSPFRGLTKLHVELQKPITLRVKTAENRPETVLELDAGTHDLKI